MKKNKLNSLKQPSYWPRLNAKKNGWINWNWKAKDIVNFINAFSFPYGGASTFVRSKILKKRKINITKAKLANSKYKFHPFQNTR